MDKYGVYIRLSTKETKKEKNGKIIFLSKIDKTKRVKQQQSCRLTDSRGRYDEKLRMRKNK